MTRPQSIQQAANTAAEPAADRRLPGRKKIRLAGIDLARGLAMLGMIAVHSLEDGRDYHTPAWSYLVSAGFASALFAVLAGVGVAFLSGRKQVAPGRAAKGIAAGLATRAAVIGMIGLLLGYTDIEWATVILPYYAVLFLVAIPVVFLPTRVIAGLTAVWLVVAPITSQLIRPHLGVAIDTQLSFGDLLTQPFNTVATLVFTGEFPAWTWAAYLLAGIVVGRCDLAKSTTPARLAATGFVLALASSIISWTLLDGYHGIRHLTPATDTYDLTYDLAFGLDGTTPTSTWWWLAANARHTGTPFDLATTIGVAIAVIGGCLLLFDAVGPRAARIVRRVCLPLVAIGSMSLTCYVAHIAFINSDFDMYGPTEGYVVQLAAMAVAATAWRATAGRGPLEGLVNTLSSRARRMASG